MRSSLITTTLLGLGLLITNGAMAATVAPVLITKRIFKTYDVKPAEVSFAGSAYHEVKSDIGDPYSAPHWQDNSSPPNGTGTDSGDHRYPISYTAGAKITVSAKFRVSPAPAAGMNLQMRAVGPGFGFPAQAVSVSNGLLVYPQTEADTALPSAITFLNPMVLNWQVSVDGGTNWKAAGQTGNRVYVTLANPLTTNFYETVLDVGARNAAGAATADAAVAAIWADFAGPIPGVKRKVIDGLNRNDGVAMRYWLDTSDPNLDSILDSCQVLAGMLNPDQVPGYNGVGTCAAWSVLFDSTLKAMGISGSQRYGVVPDTDLYPAARLMLVKNWTFSGSGTAPAECAPFNYRFSSEVAETAGVAGQGIGNPPPAFFNHFIVKYGGKWYDPSYGSGPYTTDGAWENASMDGFTSRCLTNSGSIIEVAKKNGTGVVETTFEAQ